MIESLANRIGTISLFTYVCVFAACTQSRDATETAVDSTAATSEPEPQPSVAEPGAALLDSVTGAGRLRWTGASVAERLRSAGFEPAIGSAVKQSFMSVAGTTYQVSDALVQVYIYGDAIAVARDTDGLDSTSVAPPGVSVSWQMPPSLVTDNNLAAIILTRDEATRRRIVRALTAEGNKVREP